MILSKLVIKLSFLRDIVDYKRLLHSKAALVLISLTLGLSATLGFAPYNMWVITVVSLTFEFFFISTLKSAKQVFSSLLLYFTALNAITLEWLNFVMNGFGALPLPLSWAIEILFAAYLAIFHAIFGTIAFRVALRLVTKKETAKDTATSTTPAPAPAVNTQSEANDDFDDEDYDDEDAMPQRGIASLKTSQDNTHDDLPEPSKEEIIEALDSIRPDLPGGMPGMFSQNLSLPILTDKKGQQRRFYKHVYLLCFLPVALLLADLLIGVLFTGFPWMYLGYIATDGPFASYAPLVGVRGITLVIFICAGALALTLERRFIYLPIAASLFLVGVFMMEVRYTSDLPEIKIAGVQGAIPQSIKWDPRHTMPTIEKYLSMTMEYFGKSDLIVWPESALPIFAQQIMPLLNDINIHADATGTPILLGIQRYEYAKEASPASAESAKSSADTQNNNTDANIPVQPSNDEQLITINGKSSDTQQATAQTAAQATAQAAAQAAEPAAELTKANDKEVVAQSTAEQAAQDNSADAHHGQLLSRPPRLSYNSLFLMGQGDQLAYVQIYDKRKLVPFGEVVPFAQYTRALGSIFNFPMSSFTPGSEQQQQMHLEQKDLYFIPAICYESIFPEAMAAMHDERTNGIIMVSNDSWFGDTRGPEEHLAIARMRTMEMQKPMLRITNSGISASIDALGKVQHELPRNEAAVMYEDFTPAKGNTPYMLWGNIPLYIALPLLVLVGIFFRHKEEDLQDLHFQELVRP